MPTDDPNPAPADLASSTGDPLRPTPETVTLVGRAGPATPSSAPGHPATVAAPDLGTLDLTPSQADHLARLMVSGDAAPPVAAKRYELRAEIARGGMGAVYRATDTAFGREVAVKVLQERYAPTSGTARRFADEARISGQLQHPNIPAVFDLGTLPDGRPFLAMKLIKGETLDDLLKARTDPAADRGRLLTVFEQVCQAVGYAHAHNVIHRDLKPGNVMVGAFGEVQVMDWGLAKVLGTRDGERTDPDETADPTVVQSLRQTDCAYTQAGAVLGTPAYMPPEQAVGAVHKVDARSDVFGLGAILAVILTGRPPFVGKSAETTRVQAAQGNVEECFARLDASGAESELVGLCKRCLSKNPDDRPATGGEVARAVAALRAAADERARRAELDRVKAEGDKVAAEVRVEGDRQKAEEQRKRRRVQLALAGVLVLVAVGGGVTAVQVQRGFADQQLAAEKRRQEEVREKERQTRAESLVQALLTADTTGVPRIVADLTDLRDLARPKLVELASQPVTSKPGLHARLALLPDEPKWVTEVVGYLPTCKPEELLTVRDALQSHAEAVAPGLWAVLLDPKADGGQRVRAAGALAGLTPGDERWAAVAAAVADVVVKATPGEFVVWSAALQPVRAAVLPALMKQYPESRAKIEGGKLAVADLAAEASASDLLANLLARYAADRPAELAELAVTVDARHYPLFAAAIRANRAAVVPRLNAVVGRRSAPRWAVSGHGVGLAAAAGGAGSWEAMDPDPVIQAEEKRRGYAAAMLVALGDGAAAWPVFEFPTDGDPTARSYLLQRLAGIGADPQSLMKRFDAEKDVSAKRAVLIALGDFPPEQIPDKEAFARRLLEVYRTHPDAGLHGAADWVLRQRWGEATEVAAIDAELALAARLPVAARRLADVGPLAVSPLLTAPAVATGRDWFVTGDGQTYAVVRGPVDFAIGSPAAEPDRIAANESLERKRISHTFAIAVREVTVNEFERFRPLQRVREYSPEKENPMIAITFYDCAAYCNWLSAREGIPPDQWCYEPAKNGVYGPGMRIKAGHLKLTGYRLPTEVEWEFACRGGSQTGRYYGRGVELMPRYGWSKINSGDTSRMVGMLRPNEGGLFDILGNVLEWCEDEHFDIQNSEAVRLSEQSELFLRGGSFWNSDRDTRSASRFFNSPGKAYLTAGFRPARTLP